MRPNLRLCQRTHGLEAIWMALGIPYAAYEAERYEKAAADSAHADHPPA